MSGSSLNVRRDLLTSMPINHIYYTGRGHRRVTQLYSGPSGPLHTTNHPSQWHGFVWLMVVRWYHDYVVTCVDRWITLMAGFIAIWRIWKDTTWELGLFNAAAAHTHTYTHSGHRLCVPLTVCPQFAYIQHVKYFDLFEIVLPPCFFRLHSVTVSLVDLKDLVARLCELFTTFMDDSKQSKILDLDLFYVTFWCS